MNRWLAGKVLVGLLGCCLCPAAVAAGTDAVWSVLRARLFNARPVHDDAAKVALYVPSRAEDAAAVPVTVALGAGFVADARRLWLIVDRNPVPVAATVDFGEAYRAGTAVGERRLATRIRVDAFSTVRVIVEGADGQLYHASAFVSGAGGCSAPSATQDGELRDDAVPFRIETREDGNREPAWRETRLAVRHPNYTGFQRDARGAPIAARYVDRIDVRAGGRPLLTLHGGISLADNPTLRFTHAAHATAVTLTVSGQDSRGTPLRLSGAGSAVTSSLTGSGN